MIRFNFILILCLALACDKINPKTEAPPIVFNGIKAVEMSSKGTPILSWDKAEGAEIAGYEVSMQDLSLIESSAPAKLNLSDDSDQSTPAVLTTLPDAESPAKLGKLLQVLDGQSNSYEILKLLPGRYAVQVKAIGLDGHADQNLRAAILKIDSTLGYEGIGSAVVDGMDASLEWPKLETTLTSREVIYTIYEGATFENPLAISSSRSIKLPLLSYRAGTVLYFGVRSTDAKGHSDRNTKTLTITVPNADTSYQGCVSGEARGSDRIAIHFAWPKESFEKLQILRDGLSIYSTQDKGLSTYIDIGLQEGESYTYSCVASYKNRVLVGSKTLKLSTLASNPPTFKGITSVDILSAHSAKVKWGVSSGVPAESFTVYMNPGTQVDWSAEPAAKVPSSNLEWEFTGLGDDLKYAFGVRACSAKNDCDFNEIQLLGTTANDGPPLTTGASALAIVNGKLRVTAPWTAAQGGLSKRYLYIKTNGAAGPPLLGSTALLSAGYALISTTPVPNPAAPPQELFFNQPEDNTTYHVVVMDQDPSGLKNSNIEPRSLFSGDTSKPLFNGINSVLIGAAGLEETTLRVRFTGILSEQLSTTGATTYLAYVSAGEVNACVLPTVYQSFFVADYPDNGEGQIVIAGLNPLTTYSICLKAADAAGNISINTLSYTKSTLDKTAPVFDGLQSLTYDKVRGELVLTWNPSSTSDLFEYSIKLWKSNPDPSFVNTLTVTRPATVGLAGARIARSTFAVESSEDIYALVSACDNAASVAGGSQNCSLHASSTAKKLTLADISPPPGFLGIKSSLDLLTPSQGVITVSWIPPLDWTEYRGFTVYYVDIVKGELGEVARDCACSVVGCPEQPISCDISNLDPFRSYTFHVRAYDANGNYTILDPLQASSMKRASDTTPPSFTSALLLTFNEGKADLDWADATDNQYALEPNAEIFYEVYRKRGSNFDVPTDPANDGQAAMMARTSKTTGSNWTDPGKDFVGGDRMYYTICAVDSSSNRTCDGNVKNFLTPDLFPPVISAFTTNKTVDLYSWKLSWTATDNVTLAGAILYKIYAKESALPVDTATIADTPVFIQTGTSEFLNIQGPPNVDVYIHYLLIAEDADGNRALKTLSVFSQNKLTLTSVRATEGTIAGGQLIVLQGDGFKNYIDVKIGESVCGSIVRYSRKYLMCRAPVGTVGLKNVKITNPDGSTAQLANSYKYCDGASCVSICNRPTAWGATPFPQGVGTEANPYIICNAVHLNKVRTIPGGNWFQLGANIDMTGVSMLPLVSSNGWGGREFVGKFNGDNHVIANWTYSEINAVDPVGLFRIINGSIVKNLGLINFQITGKNWVGALAGATGIPPWDPNYWCWNDSALYMNGIFVTGTIVGSNRVGGIAGVGCGNKTNMTSFATVTGVNVVGGLFGYGGNGVGDVEYQGNVMAKGNGNYCEVGGIGGFWISNGYNIVNATTAGTVTCRDDPGLGGFRTGGIVGFFRGNGTLENVENNATVTGKNWLGGIVGQMEGDGSIIGSRNNGSVIGNGNVGGMVGVVFNGIKITDSVNDGVIKGSGIGGAVGYIDGTGPNTLWPRIENFVNKKDILGTGNSVGGIVGYGKYLEVVNSSNRANVQGQVNVGGVVGNSSYFRCTNSNSVGNLTASSFAGGIVGQVVSTTTNVITGCSSSGTIVSGNYTGGIAGYYRGTITSSESSANITGLMAIGGIIGVTESGTALAPTLVEKSSFTGTIIGDNQCGGIIGEVRLQTTMRKDKSSADISCNQYGGGIAGTITGNTVVIDQSSSRGKVHGGLYIGGVLGGASKTTVDGVFIKDSYSRADVKGNESVGGLAGYFGSSISRSYSSGKVEKDATESLIGGMVGRIYSTGVSADSYWDLTKSNQANSVLGEGKTTSNMLGNALYLNYSAATWSFSNLDYPKLLWEVSP